MVVGILTHKEKGEIKYWSARRIVGELKSRNIDFAVANFKEVDIKNGECFF